MKLSRRRTVYTLVAAVAGLLFVPQARADDCNALIEAIVAYLQAPKAANECPGSYHVAAGFITVSSVSSIQIPSAEPGQPPQAQDLGSLNVALTRVTPDTFFNIVMEKRIHGPGGHKTPAPVQPYELLSGDLHLYGNGGYEGAGALFTPGSTDVKVHVIEGAAGAPSRVELIPTITAPTPFTRNVVLSGAATCKGSFLTGNFDASTMFTLALVKTRAGSCAF
jgi:hypothetical protein